MNQTDICHWQMEVSQWLLPVVTAIQQRYGDSNLCRALIDSVVRLGTGDWEEREVVERARAYVSAVELYIEETAPLYPIDPVLVATNRKLCPADTTTTHSTDCITLVSPSGTVYGDPVAIVTDELRPARLISVALADGIFVSLAQAAHCLRGSLRFPQGQFPILAARSGEGQLYVRHPTGKWSSFSIGASIDASISADSGYVGSLVSSSSAAKGARGESYVFRLIQNRTSYFVSQVSHKPRSADILVEAFARKVYIDVKDYAIPVPDKEVQKFKRDLNSRGADAGVFISLSGSGIVGLKGTMIPMVESLPTEGRFVPIVYVSSCNGDVILAAVDLALYFAKNHPGCVDAYDLHPRDTLEAYANDLERITDACEAAKADLGRLALSSSAGFGASLEKLGSLVCEQRRLVRAQRAAVEHIADVQLGNAAWAWEQFVKQYGPPATLATMITELLKSLLDKNTVSGHIRDQDKWRLQKTKAVHASSGAAFLFQKTRISFSRELSDTPWKIVQGLLSRHPKKVRVSEGTVLIEISDSTFPDAMELANL